MGEKYVKLNTVSSERTYTTRGRGECMMVEWDWDNHEYQLEFYCCKCGTPLDTVDHQMSDNLCEDCRVRGTDDDDDDEENDPFKDWE